MPTFDLLEQAENARNDMRSLFIVFGRMWNVLEETPIFSRPMLVVADHLMARIAEFEDIAPVTEKIALVARHVHSLTENPSIAEHAERVWNKAFKKLAQQDESISGGRDLSGTIYEVAFHSYRDAPNESAFRKIIRDELLVYLKDKTNPAEYTKISNFSERQMGAFLQDRFVQLEDTALSGVFEYEESGHQPLVARNMIAAVRELVEKHVRPEQPEVDRFVAIFPRPRLLN